MNYTTSFPIPTGSNAGILNTIYDLAGEDAFPEEFLENVKPVKVNNSSCQVYMGIKKDEKIDDIGDLIFTSTAP